ncbi:MAG: cysteine methyltransferase, partial [Patescibacteria group bacterium]|nr:cysteine methyltransferase [Patescibacteria group bacterium]
KGTSFQEKVWKALSAIPSGSTATYGSIAEQAGNPKAIRAVGTAIGRNPICIIIPCHRVLGSGGGLGGFVAGIEKKEKLLHLEATKI